MARKNTQEIIKKLQNSIAAAISPLMSKKGAFALLDFPNYANVGDSAIWLGQIEYFRQQHGSIPSYVSEISAHNSGELRQTMPKGTIFLNGGGNFGDLWPRHQQFREKILQEFHDYPVVQLPQSIHFQDPERLQEAARIIKAHPDFTLLVRDHKTLAIAQANFSCKIIMCPDMAFALGDLSGQRQPTRDLLLLLRTDSEKKTSGPASFGGATAEDWVNEDSEIAVKTRREVILSLPFKLGLQAFSRPRQRELLFRRLAEKRLERGLQQIQSARFTVTDRLHTHILSLLSDRDHIALDNSYGKVSNFIAAWTKDSQITQQASTLEAALELYENWKNSQD